MTHTPHQDHKFIYHHGDARDALPHELPIHERARQALNTLDSAATWQNPNDTTRLALAEGANVIELLAARVAELEAALAYCITDDGAAGMRDAGTFARKRLDSITERARAALERWKT